MWPWKRNRQPHADPARIAELERELGLGDYDFTPSEETKKHLAIEFEGVREIVTAGQYVSSTVKMEDVVVYTTAYGEQFVVTPENFLAVVANDGLRK